MSTRGEASGARRDQTDLYSEITDKVFKELADQNHRRLLDKLCDENGQTLAQLCNSMDMKRQSVTQHLGLLEQANLISTVRRGR